jgi:hypothetical protein
MHPIKRSWENLKTRVSQVLSTPDATDRREYAANERPERVTKGKVARSRIKQAMAEYYRSMELLKNFKVHQLQSRSV